MQALMTLLLILLVICAVAVSAQRKLLAAVIIFMSYSMIMSIVWLLLRAPDLAITEAAVGAGVTSILFFLTLRKVNENEETGPEEEPEKGFPKEDDPETEEEEKISPEELVKNTKEGRGRYSQVSLEDMDFFQ